MSEPHRLDPDYRRPPEDGGLERPVKRMLDLNDKKGVKSKAIKKKRHTIKSVYSSPETVKYFASLSPEDQKKEHSRRRAVVFSMNNPELEEERANKRIKKIQEQSAKWSKMESAGKTPRSKKYHELKKFHKYANEAYRRGLRKSAKSEALKSRFAPEDNPLRKTKVNVPKGRILKNVRKMLEF